MWTDKSKSRAIKEWVIFAVCMGLGGHIALALLLHAPADQWPQRVPMVLRRRILPLVLILRLCGRAVDSIRLVVRQRRAVRRG